MLIKFLKKKWVVAFGSTPYRIRKFRDMYPVIPGSPIDQAESLTGILMCEQGGPVCYPLPLKAYSKAINQRFIGKKKRFADTGLFRSPDRYVFSVSGACIAGQTGWVYDPEQRSLIDESAKEWTIFSQQSPYANAWHLPAKTYLKGITLSYLSIGADGGFYHFLFESIVKTGMYQATLPYADHLLFNGPPLDWKLKWITRAGIDVSKIIWVDNMGHYACEQLIFTNRLVGDQRIDHWAVDTLHRTLHIPKPTPAATDEPARVIWISRKGASQRDLDWEDDLLKEFAHISRIDLSLLSVEETILCLRKATHVIGPHGAGLSNIYLCHPGTKILEIYPEGAYFQPCYHRLSTVCQLDHAVLYLDFKNKENIDYGIHTFRQALTQLTC